MNITNHKRKTHEQFVQELSLIQPELKIISRYTGNNESIIVKDKLGICYSSKPHSLLQNHSPSILSAVDKNIFFAIKSNIIHDNIYDYSLVDYRHDMHKVIIVCKQHGNFLMTPNNHFQGNKCPKCDYENRPGTMHSVSKYNPDLEIYLYFFKCYNNKEKFYKIGLSVNPVQRSKQIPYNTEILGITKGLVKDLFTIEQDHHKKFKELKINYIPLIDFGGKHECCK